MPSPEGFFFGWLFFLILPPIAIFVLIKLGKKIPSWLQREAGLPPKTTLRIFALALWAFCLGLWLYPSGVLVSKLIMGAYQLLIGSSLALGIAWLAHRFFQPAPRIVATFFFTTFFLFLFGFGPARDGFLDALIYRHSMTPIVVLEPSKNDQGRRFNLSKAYFDDVLHRAHGVPAGEGFWFQATYPSFEPWAVATNKHEKEWLIKIYISPHGPLHDGTERYTFGQVESDIRAGRNAKPGLSADYDLIAYDDARAGAVVRRYAPEQLNPATPFGIECSPTLCRRFPLTDDPIGFAYFIPRDQLANWREIESNVLAFIQTHLE